MKALLIAAAMASAASAAQFEVASIKPADASAPSLGRMGSYIDTHPTLLNAGSATLKELIQGVYGVEDTRWLEARVDRLGAIRGSCQTCRSGQPG